VRLTGEDYDVRGLSFLRSGALLFLAKHEGSTGLFSIKSGAVPSLFFSPGAEVASFSVSPDEHYIALTERIHNRWQLALLDVPNHRIKLLTTTDCNAYTPEWSAKSSIIYATDCGRGVGLTALAGVDISAAMP
jgi:dipeptidyl aminopeptidase/acylaminoacyl peptidase